MTISNAVGNFAGYRQLCGRIPEAVIKGHKISYVPSAVRIVSRMQVWRVWTGLSHE
jgi:hypothetical protein